MYGEALKLVFLVAVAFGGLACLLFLVEKDVTLRKELETEYGIIDKKTEAGNRTGNEDSEKTNSGTVQ